MKGHVITHTIQAMSEYRLSQFSNALESVNRAYGDLTNSLEIAIDPNNPDGDYLDIDGNFEFNIGDKLFNGQWEDTNFNNRYDNGERRAFDEYPLNYDVNDSNDVQGRAYLANHLSLLSNYTAPGKSTNSLSCGCED